MGMTRVSNVGIVLIVLIASVVTSVWADAPTAQQLPDDGAVPDGLEQVPPGGTPQVGNGGEDGGGLVELRLDNVPASEAAHDLTTGPRTTTAAGWLTLDDGSAESNLGVIQEPGDTSQQFLWLNRFSLGTAQFPFRLWQIHVFFDAIAAGAGPGEPIDLVVYQDNDGDPSNGATLLATLSESVKVADGTNWSVYELSPPVLVPGPGDVLIGVISRYVDSGTTLATYPAALDMGDSQRRSWIGWWSGGDPPDPAILPPDDTFSLVDDLGSPGNWMVRGFGGAVHIFLPVAARTPHAWGDDFEDNDNWWTAYGPLEFDQAYRAYPDDTEDYYYLELSKRGPVSVFLDDYAPTSSYGTLALYGPAIDGGLGDLIGYYGLPGDSSMSLGPYELDPGKYYVRVRTVEGHYSGAQLYSLRLTSNAVGCRPGTLTPDDPGYSQQWGMDKINAPRAWFCDFRGDSEVIVAVIDSGVDMEHPEFSGRLVAGRDWANTDSWPDDDYGHGTHVAGIVGAAGNNGFGVAGVAWNARIMPLKTLGADGSGYVSWSSEAVIWAADHGADVINMSLGSTDFSQAHQDAITYAHNKGVLVVASAGNCGDGNFRLNGCTREDQASYPGNYAHVVAVAATTSRDVQSSFSTQGSYVDIAAPGGDGTLGGGIYSSYRDGRFATMSGTSQASPHVAGLAALIKAAHPNYTPDQIAAAMQSTAFDLGSPGKDIQYGWGRIDAAAALEVASAAATSTDSVTVEPKPLTRDSGAEFAPGVVLAKFRPGVLEQTTLNVLSDLKQSVQIVSSVPGIELLVLSVPVGSEWDMIESLRALPLVEYAEPDLVVRAN